jgi:hypothetical protein
VNAPEGFLATALGERRIDRRGFLTFAARGLAVAFTMPLAGRVATVRAATPPTNEQLADAYVYIGNDGKITLYFGGAEMGQGASCWSTGTRSRSGRRWSIRWSRISPAAAARSADGTHGCGRRAPPRARC